MVCVVLSRSLAEERRWWGNRLWHMIEVVVAVAGVRGGGGGSGGLEYREEEFDRRLW